MEKYSISKILGDGTYGTVYFAIIKSTGDKVAIKKMKKNYYSWDECLELREVKTLRKLNHYNIVKLKELIRDNNVLYFIFEHMNGNLYELIKTRSKGFTDDNIRTISYQMLNAIGYLHQQGFFHRDIKPENFLYNNIETIKLADFGLAREIRSRPPFSDYVSTRWYRAPELLLRSTNYSASVDIWAVACIIIELYNLRPIFPGTSEIDQLFKICAILGSPSQCEWEEGFRLSNKMNFKWPNCVKMSLFGVVRKASHSAIDLLELMLSFNPESRPSATGALKFNYFSQRELLIKQKISSNKEQNFLPKKHQSFQNQLNDVSLKNQSIHKSLDEETEKNIINQSHKMSSVMNFSNLFKNEIPTTKNAIKINIDKNISGKDPSYSFHSFTKNKKPSLFTENKFIPFNQNHIYKQSRQDITYNFEENIFPYRKPSKLSSNPKSKDPPIRPVSLISGTNKLAYVPSLLDHLSKKSIYPDKQNNNNKHASRRLNPLNDIFDK